jgi:hypothetical protein
MNNLINLNTPIPRDLKDDFLAHCQRRGTVMAAVVRNLICDHMGIKRVNLPQGRRPQNERKSTRNK